jgi:hypothetical protein
MKNKSLTPSPTASIWRNRVSIGKAGAVKTGPVAPMPVACGSGVGAIEGAGTGAAGDSNGTCICAATGRDAPGWGVWVGDISMIGADPRLRIWLTGAADEHIRSVSSYSSIGA